MNIVGNDKTKLVIKTMIEKEIIPQSGIFEVTNSLIDKYFEIYKSFFPNEKKNRKTDNRYIRKLVGFSFLKLNNSRSQEETIISKKKPSLTKLKFGIVYLISNPAFPGKYKIGMTQDLEKRLKQYQTYDPHKQFKVEHYRIVDDRKLEEKIILEKFSVDIISGEWIDNKKVKEIFKEF